MATNEPRPRIFANWDSRLSLNEQAERVVKQGYTADEVLAWLADAESYGYQGRYEAGFYRLVLSLFDGD